MHGLVSCDTNPVSKEVVWYATDEGIKRWTLEGRLHVAS
jgi:hypothetical protein